MEFYRQANGAQSVNSGEGSYTSSGAIAYKLPSTPPSTPIEEAIPPLTSLTTPDLLPSDMIIGVYNREYGTVSFQGSIGDLQFGATVLLKDHELRAYGPLLPTANGEIGVVFHFKNSKVWSVYVIVPYMDVESRLFKTVPESPSLPKADCLP
jgi:hypothetical protein